VVVIPGEGAGYIYYSASSGGAAPAPAEDPTLVGQVSAFVKLPLPDWVACEGQTISAAAYPKLVEYLAGASATAATVPDLRGYFLRGSGTNSATGVYSAALGLRQDDAIRNITGTFGRGFYSEYNNAASTGAFVRSTAKQSTKYTNEGWSANGIGLDFDASRVVPTADENRPHNIAVIYAMRAK